MLTLTQVNLPFPEANGQLECVVRTISTYVHLIPRIR